MASHASSSRLARAPDALPAEDAHYWDRLLWQIRRKNEINQEQTDTAIDEGHVARDPSTVTGIPGDPGAITAVLANYVNSAQTTVRGIDIDGRQRFDLGHDYGSLTFDIKSTHLYKWLRTEQDGTQRNFAGTHGNCDVSNCMGTPNNRVNLGVRQDGFLVWD